MGIQGLLPLLKSIMLPIHIKELEGSCVAVDTYSWLHKGALCCSTELCKGIPTSRHIDYCMHRVNLLRHYGVKPVMVFDGGLLPMKGDQENKRSRSRKENLTRAIEHEADGNSTAAYECYQKAVDISPAIAYELIQVLKRENIFYVVAPYEADAQLTFLAITKQVEAVITEDSDLIPFGCPRIIFKMDKFGQGVQFHKSMLQRNRDISFMGFNKQMILEMCIMSGCDYLQSLPGMGLKKAHALIKKFKSYDKAIKHLRYSSVSMPPMYEESFKKAIWTFQYQRVYDPAIEDIVYLADLPDNMNDDLDFLGLMPQPVAKGVALGDLDPFTKLPFKVAAVGPQKTYTVNSFKPETERKKLQLPSQRNLVTNYLKVGTDHLKDLVGESEEIYPSTVQSSHAILPCRNKKMLRDQECKEPMDEIGCKVRPGSQMVIVRSSYFQTKGAGQNSFEHVDRKVCDTDDIADNKYKNDVLQFNKDVATDEGERGILSVKVNNYNNDLLQVNKDVATDEGEQAILSVKINRDGVAVNKGVKGTIDDKNVSLTDKIEDTKEGAVAEFCFNNALPKLKVASSSSIKTIENGKAVTRSSYFHRTKFAGGDLKTEMEMTFPIERNLAYNDQLTAEDSPAGAGLKRKVSCQEENRALCGSLSYLHGNAKWRKQSTSDSLESDNTFMNNNQFTEPNQDEKKFGCNISHLDNYKDISGKSFQSLTSSFKFNSSGSRASGLRAPLKDVRNISKNRPAGPVADISKFSYVPSTEKVVWKPRSRRG